MSKTVLVLHGFLPGGWCPQFLGPGVLPVFGAGVPPILGADVSVLGSGFPVFGAGVPSFWGQCPHFWGRCSYFWGRSRGSGPARGPGAVVPPGGDGAALQPRAAADGKGGNSRELL